MSRVAHGLRLRILLLALTAGMVLGGCGPKPPVKIGFLGSLSGPAGDLGSAGRNGALLAVELKNAAGGVNGRRVELLMRDDRLDGDIALQALREFDQAGAVAVAGPMTSAVARAIAPGAAEIGLVVVGGTVATSELSNRDDHFFRVIGSSTTYATRSAVFARKEMRARSALVAIDLSNAEYTESWAADFRSAFEQTGADVLEIVRFDSRQPTDFGPIAARVKATRPDLVALVMSARDAGLLGRRIRIDSPKVGLLGSGWTASNRLIEMGGEAIEGMWVELLYDMDSDTPVWQAMRTAYRERFGVSPDYAALAGYDAASVVMEAIERGATRSTMKSVLLSGRAFAGVHVPIRFDAHGDPERALFIGRVSGGKLVTQR